VQCELTAEVVLCKVAAARTSAVESLAGARAALLQDNLSTPLLSVSMSSVAADQQPELLELATPPPRTAGSLNVWAHATAGGSCNVARRSGSQTSLVEL
jgi:hypothetical protein